MSHGNRSIREKEIDMATDIVLRTLVIGMHRGHLVSMLRNADGSGFYDLDDQALFERNETLVNEARDAFGENDVFASGPLEGRRIRSFSTGMQAQALMGRLPIAPAERQQPLVDREHAILDRPYMPFLLDQQAREEILDAILIAGGDVQAATAFLDANHGATAVVVCE
jgi:hypothetical protein